MGETERERALKKKSPETLFVGGGHFCEFWVTKSSESKELQTGW